MHSFKTACMHSLHAQLQIKHSLHAQLQNSFKTASKQLLHRSYFASLTMVQAGLFNYTADDSRGGNAAVPWHATVRDLPPARWPTC